LKNVPAVQAAGREKDLQADCAVEVFGDVGGLGEEAGDWGDWVGGGVGEDGGGGGAVWQDEFAEVCGDLHG
jgi:hypothetical protein